MDENEEARKGLEVGKFLKFKANDDILMEIFLQLPEFYSIIKCSHVCRRWRRVICHPYFSFQCRVRRSATPVLFTLLLGRRGYDPFIPFAQLTGTTVITSVSLSSSTALLRHLHRHRIISLRTSTPSLGHLRLNGSHYLDFLPQWQDIQVKASCNDLLLLQFPWGQLCVCNPMTRRRSWLPQPPWPFTEIHHHFYALASDPISGRGYRVLLFQENSVSVYNSETREWGEYLPHPPRPEERVHHTAWKVATRDGVVYSLLEDSRTYYYKNIVAFDPFDPSGRPLSVGLPHGFKGGWRTTNGRTQTWVVRGRLRLWQAYWENSGSFVFRLWELKLDPHEWLPLQNLALTSEGDTFTPKSLVFALHPDDDYTFYLRDDRPFVLQYHIRSHESLKINCDISSCTRHCYHILPLVHPPWPTDV